jgi:hypothetical protein
VREQTREGNQRYADTASRRRRVLNIDATMAAVISVGFVIALESLFRATPGFSRTGCSQ